MMTEIDKNLVIASLESALDTARQRAGLTTLATVERLIAQLRARFQAKPDQVTDYEIRVAYEILVNIALPSLRNLQRIIDQFRFAQFVPPQPTPPTDAPGFFDGSGTFDGSQTFGGQSGATGRADGSAAFDGSQKFDGGTT